MTRTVTIKYKDVGSIVYESDDVKKYTVNHPDQYVIDEINLYMQTEQDFEIPESQKIDDYRIDRAKPVDNPTYFGLALCTLTSETGIDVIKWE